MLCLNAKKTDAAFRKLELSTAQNTSKANHSQAFVKPSSVADALRMAFGAGKPSKRERIRQTLGNAKFLYYRYIDFFKNIPSSLDDMIDGLIYIHLTSDREG